MDPRLRVLLALILGFLAFNVSLQLVDRLVSSYSPSCMVYYEYEGKRGTYVLRRLVLGGPVPFNGSFKVALEFDDPRGVRVARNCSLLRAEVVKVKAGLFSANEYREVMLVNVSGVYAARGGRLDGVAVDLGRCLETHRPYGPRILLYPVSSGTVRGVDRVMVTVAGQGSGG